ncbi:hypothetical protein MP228_009574 [Amoeboaphelidium protococcarum]|nr:hypothetical protein MP228_009574 [Amoeboaphelidium protococcarum]
MYNLKFLSAPVQDVHQRIIIGEKNVIASKEGGDLKWLSAVNLGSTSTSGVKSVVQRAIVQDESASATWFPESADQPPVTVATFASERSRNLGVIRGDAITELLPKLLPAADKGMSVLLTVVLASKDQVHAATTAIARALPVYNRKTTSKAGSAAPSATVNVQFVLANGSSSVVNADEAVQLQITADSVRLCARLVDMPANELSTDAYVQEAKQVFEHLQKTAKGGQVSMKVIRGEELRDGGFGGLWGVGKGAPFPPALVVLSYQPESKSQQKSVAMVGKGICFDTGGLNIKVANFMLNMKTDMGGSAAILAAFKALVQVGYKNNLTALLCIAENSVSAESTRPDDILNMYSGKTVEINNTDAEGRLVLADGVAYATKDLQPVPTHLIDMATLTGAQMVATGMNHAAVLSNDAEFEQLMVQSGKESGDLCYPILYCPELLKKEFKSDVADMQNSVKSRTNAQSSCAGHFVEDHINSEWKGKWAHIDIAGPSSHNDRGTGFGTALLVRALRKLEE